jgi:hypothetical protein
MIVVYAESSISFGFGLFTAANSASTPLHLNYLIIFIKRKAVTFNNGFCAFFWTIPVSRFFFSGTSRKVIYLIASALELITSSA